MKTAMQLHLDDLEKSLVIIKDLGMAEASTALESVINNGKHYLEKEKEQIEAAVIYGATDFITKSSGNYSAEDYYNDTFTKV